MELFEAIRYRDEFYSGGFRKIFAPMLVVAVTVLPKAFAWVAPPMKPPAASRMPTGRFRSSGGLLLHARTRTLVARPRPSHQNAGESFAGGLPK